MFDRSHYRADIKRKIVKNPFIHHSFKAMNDFFTEKCLFLLFCDNWYFSPRVAYQTFSKLSRELNGTIFLLLWIICIQKMWKTNCMKTKDNPRNIYVLTDWIRTPFCASLNSGIGNGHQSQTWRYQGATVAGRKNFSTFLFVLNSPAFPVIHSDL